MKHLFIVNPIAGGKDSSPEIRLAAESLLSEQNYEIYITKAPMDACEKIKAEAESGEELRVYACGGDGTLNECVCGAVGRQNVAVTHFPCGTGNDFIKMFGEEKELFFQLEKLIDGEVRALDVVDVNGRYSINICSVGIDARIGTEVHKYSKLPLVGGATGYLVSLVVNLLKGINQHLVFTAGEFHYDGSAALACICNGCWYGGSFNPVKTARPDDGILDVLLVKKTSRVQFLALVGKYASGRFAEIKEHIEHLRVPSLHISSEMEMVVNLDGEAIYAKDIDFRILPGGVRFFVPKNMRYFAGKAPCAAAEG